MQAGGRAGLHATRTLPLRQRRATLLWVIACLAATLGRHLIAQLGVGSPTAPRAPACFACRHNLMICSCRPSKMPPPLLHQPFQLTRNTCWSN